MTLKLHFFTHARLWSEVVISEGKHVFVPSIEALSVGQVVRIAITTPEMTEPLLVSGVVEAFRPLAAPQPAGLLVNLDPISLEKCRAMVAKREPHARLVGRTEPRIECALPARLLRPQIVPGCVVKSLSVSGAALTTPGQVPDGPLHFAVQLSPGIEVSLVGQVMWSRPELRLAGLKFSQIDAMTEQRIRAAMESLAERHTQLPAVTHTVLVADDDVAILDFTTRIVAKLGHKVLRAERGDAALAMVRTERPDLVLLDVLMPGLDGLEVCKAIRADAALAKTPVILLSAMGEDRLPEAAKSAGADGYLTKPMRLDALRMLLSQRLPATRSPT